MVKYKVLSFSTIQALEKEVDYYLSRGWDLVGGISTTCDKHDEIQYTQAMMIDKTPTDEWDY